MSRLERAPNQTAARPARLTGAGVWLRSSDGGMTVFGLFVFVTMLLVAEIAVDMMRVEHERVGMQGASDRAVLAGAAIRDNSGASTGAIIDSFLRAEGLEGHVQERVSITDRGTMREVQVAPAARISSGFMRMLGVNDVLVATPSTAIESLSQIDFEIVMVLDVSGSMIDAGRIEAMRHAAIQFAESMLTVGEPGQVAITIVPYSTEVLLPQAILARLTDLAPATNLQTYDVDSAMQPVYNLWGQLTYHTDDSCIDFGDWAGVETRILDSVSQPWVRRFCNEWSNTEYTTPQVRPMIGDLPALTAYVNAMGPVWGTSIDLGVRAGALFFDPSLRPAISQMIALGQVDPVFSDRPFNLDRANVVRAMLLMTDGENCCFHHNHPSTRHLTAEIQDRATTDACAGVRELGVTIYSVAFEAPQRGIDVMQACATSPNHFFSASSAEVVDAFLAIGTHIQRQSLRLTQ